MPTHRLIISVALAAWFGTAYAICVIWPDKPPKADEPQTVAEVAQSPAFVPHNFATVEHFSAVIPATPPVVAQVATPQPKPVKLTQKQRRKQQQQQARNRPRGGNTGQDLATRQVMASERAAAAAEQQSIDYANAHRFDSLYGWPDQP